MTIEEMIKDVNSLPLQAQQQVADFIDFIKQKYPEVDALPKKNPNLSVEDSFGMYSVDTAITLEDIQQAMGVKLDSDIPNKQEKPTFKHGIEAGFGIFKA